MELEIDAGERELTDDERRMLQEEMPRIKVELRRRFGEVTCEVHGQQPKVAVLDVSKLPTVDFRFRDVCCDVMERLLVEAAKAP